MKHIKTYKIFEDIDEDENDIIPDGFKYSWNDIYESLLYLTDIGFEIDEKSQKRYLADEKATLHDLADEYGVSAERIRQIENGALKKLKALMVSAA